MPNNIIHLNDEVVKSELKELVKKCGGDPEKMSVPKNNPCKRITPTAASRLGKQQNKATLRSDLDASCG